MLSIDALRGIAAFLVVVFHVFAAGKVFEDRLSIGNLSGWNYLYFFPAYGYVGVYLFFVISGFCIHLRWAKTKASDDKRKPKIDFIAFWKRRWIRLYPAYIAAMILYLWWEYHQGMLVFNGFFAWDTISHLLMIHNFDNRTAYSMNGVFWTLAIEEQLYLLYFLLLFLRERWGWTVTLTLTFASRFLWLGVSLFVTKVIGFELPFTEGALANWWIWALGAIAIENYYKVIEFPRWCYSPWIGSFFFICAAAVKYLGFASPATHTFEQIAFVAEPFLWGASFFFLINFVTSREKVFAGLRSGRFSFVAAWAFVGLFSYSLYLTHELLLPIAEGVNRYLVCILCLVFAYVFFLIFERPFMVFLARQKTRPNSDSIIPEITVAN